MWQCALSYSFAVDSSIRVSEVECDSSTKDNAINGGQSQGFEGAVMEDIKAIMLSNGVGTCRFVLRQGNKLAHAVVKLAFNSIDDWLHEPPWSFDSTIYGY